MSAVLHSGANGPPDGSLRSSHIEVGTRSSTRASVGTSAESFRHSRSGLRPNPLRQRDPGEQNAALRVAKRLYALRRRRTSALGVSLFADPGWDMLLDLYVSEAGGRRLSVTAACIGADASMATAIRYIGLLCDAGLSSREPDPSDSRRTYIGLTEEGWSRMTDLLLTMRD